MYDAIRLQSKNALLRARFAVAQLIEAGSPKKFAFSQFGRFRDRQNRN
jgi:hypothetical protein